MKIVKAPKMNLIFNFLQKTEKEKKAVYLQYT